MSDDLRRLFQSIGALSEMLAIIREELIKNGFTRAEAVYLVGIVLQNMIDDKTNGENGQTI